MSTLGKTTDKTSVNQAMARTGIPPGLRWRRMWNRRAQGDAQLQREWFPTSTMMNFTNLRKGQAK